MATLRTLYEVAVRGGTESEAQLRKVGQVGAEAFEKIDAAAKKVPTSLRAVDAAASTVKGKIEGLAASTGPLGAALSAIGGPLGLIGVAGTAAGLGVLALAKNAIAAGDAIADSAKQVGLGVEQFQALQFGARLAGVETAQLEGALKKFGTGVAAAGVGTGALVKTLGVLDPALLGTIQHATSVEQAFTAMAAKIAATKDPFEQVQLAVASFGAKSAEAMLPVIVNLEATTKRANELHLIMGGDLVRSTDSAQDALETLSQTIGVNLDAALIALAPSIEAAANKLASLVARIGGFFQSITGLEATENLLAKLRNERDNLDNAAPGTVPANKRGQLDQKIADLEAERRAILANKDAEAAAAKDRDKAAKDRHEAFLKLKTDHDADIKAGKDAAKAASDAAAAQKKAASDHAAGIAEIVKLEQEAQTAGLEGVEKLEAERDVAYQKFAELVEQDKLNQEEAARGYLAIWVKADREITAEREKEADKQADIAKRAAEKEAKAAARLAEQAAEAWERPLEEFAGNVGDLLGDALTTFVHDGKLQFDDLWKGFLDAGLNAIGHLVSEQIKLNIIAAVTGQQQPGQILNLFGGGTGTGSSTGIFKSLLDGVTSLGSDIFGLSSATLENTNAIADWTQAVGFSGETFTGAAEAGASQFATTTTPGVTGGAGSALSSGAALGAAGAVLGILGVAFGTAAAVDAVRRTRRFKFTTEEVFKAANKAALDSEFGQLGEIIGAGHTASAFFNPNAKAGDRVIAGILTIGTSELLRKHGGTSIFKPPTGGTALRANFEEFIESQGDDGANINFFSGNRFRRGIGQDATRALLIERFAKPRGVKGFDGFSPPEGAFVVAMRDVIQAQKESIGLSDKQLQQFTALAAVFRASVGKKAGNEEQRTLGIIADTLGSLERGGVKVAEAMDIVGTAIEKLASPAESFRILNEFFTSKHNDIAVQDYAAAVQGLAQVFFTDLPLGVRAADLALEEFHKDGVVTFEEMATRITDVSAAAELLVPVFQQLTTAISADPSAFFTGDIVDEQAITQFHDAILTAMRDATINGFVQAMLQASLEPTVLEPFTKISRETIGKVTSGEITPEAGLAILKQAGIDAAASLEALDPFIRQFITDVADLGESFDTLSGKATKAGDALLAGAFGDLGTAVAGSAKDFLVNADLASDQAIDAFHDAVLAAMREATIAGFIEAMATDVIQSAVLEPFTALATATFAKITSGEISPEEGVRQLNAAFADAESALHTLDPALQAFIKNVANLSNSIGGGGEFSARELAGAGLDRQLLGALDPQLGKQFDLELTQRQRLHDAKALGLDLTKVERLNALEREAIAQASADELAKIEQDRADQIARVMDQFFADVERNLEAIRDLATSLTASPASPLPPEVAFANAKANLQQLFAAAQGGDADALAKIPEAFQNAEALARQLFGSTDRFFQFFGPALAQLEASGALDAKSFALSKDAQAQIDAINTAAHEQIDTENKHHAEAMALFQAMLDALTLTAAGDEITQAGGGSGPGDFKAVGRIPPGEPSSARFGIDTLSQSTAQSVLAGLVPGGQTEQFLTFLGGLSSWQAVQGWAATSGPIGHLAATLLAIAPGVRSLEGWRTLVDAFSGKIQHPDAFSPVLGFAGGGSFLVPGRPGSGDIFPMLPNVRASPGETVTVTTHGMDQALRDLRDVNARIGVDTVATLRALQAQNAELLGRVASLERAILGEVQRPRVVPLQTRVL